MPAKFTNADVAAGKLEKCSLPETTVCRSTKGDQYRISGPSYVLAGTAILKRNHFTSSRDLSAPAVVRRLRSVDVIEIDLAGLSLGDPAALGDDAHARKRHRRGENLLVGIPSLDVGAGHLSLSALGQREKPVCRLTLWLCWSRRLVRWAVSDNSDLASSRTCTTDRSTK